MFCLAPAYLAPEQIRVEEVDARADLFALDQSRLSSSRANERSPARTRSIRFTPSCIRRRPISSTARRRARSLAQSCCGCSRKRRQIGFSQRPIWYGRSNSPPRQSWRCLGCSEPQLDRRMSASRWLPIVATLASRRLPSDVANGRFFGPRFTSWRPTRFTWTLPDDTRLFSALRSRPMAGASAGRGGSDRPQRNCSVRDLSSLDASQL